ncbi:fibronectin/fibrinogen-binding protein [candidate division KSB1 bacterium]|nr:fibronectin/fibrinogen-binding protein [candidate division KSB1 bacterium]
MPELPEAVVMARQMDETVQFKTITSVDIAQPKILNRPVDDLTKTLPQRIIEKVYPYGKWIGLQLSDDVRLMISLGMGGEIIYFKQGETPPEKSRFILHFSDGTGFYITLWWFGYVHLVLPDETHVMTDSQGPNPLTMDAMAFHALLDKRKGAIKSFLLNQKRIRGIGNFYIQEILFRARIHPLRPIPSLSTAEIDQLFQSIHSVFNESIDLDSSWYEQDFFGNKGQYTLENMSLSFKEGDLCPKCQTQIKKIKTGSTSQYICSACQTL